MDLDETITKKIPARVREGAKRFQFGMLLGFVRENNIKTVKQLKDLLEDQINTCRSWLEKSMTAPTMGRMRREWVKKLEYFSEMKELVGRYLK